MKLVKDNSRVQDSGRIYVVHFFLWIGELLYFPFLKDWCKLDSLDKKELQENRVHFVRRKDLPEDRVPRLED